MLRGRVSRRVFEKVDEDFGWAYVLRRGGLPRWIKAEPALSTVMALPD